MDESLVEHSTLGQTGDQIHSLRVFGIGHVDLFRVTDYPFLQGIEALVLPKSHLQHTELVSWNSAGALPHGLRPDSPSEPSLEQKGRLWEVPLRSLFPAWHFSASAPSPAPEERREKKTRVIAVMSTQLGRSAGTDPQARPIKEPQLTAPESMLCLQL